NVKDMSYLFCADDSLREIVNLSALDTGNVVDISGMFGKYMHDALFGTMSDKKNLPTTYWTSRDSGSWINDRTVASGFENPTFDVRFYGQSGNTGFFGPAIESLDLSNFDTRNVKYAYGAFCWMPNLKEIKWGGNTTFEKVTDANFMFILPALKKMDLTGRKFNSLKYAFRMLMLYSAESLTLGKDSLNLSAIAQDEGFTVSVPRVREVDFRNVKFGDNNKAFSGYSLYDDYWVSHQFVYEAEGLVAATDLKFPAMPEFATAAKLPPVSFKDGNNTEFTTIQGGNTGEISLTSGDDPAKLPVESVGVTAVIDMGTSGDGWMMNNGEKYKLLATIHPLRAVQDVTWTSSDTSIATVDEDGIVTAVGGKYGGAEVTITATSKADSSKSGSSTIKVYLAMLDGDEPAPSPTPSPTPTPTPVPDNMDVTGISLNKSAVSMYPNETFKLSATVSPAGAGNKTVSWSSSDTGVATVDANGNVKAKAAGTDGSAATATITATANGAASGSTVTASCTVTVLPSEIVETGEDDTPIDPGIKAIDETSGEAKVWVAGLNNSGYYYTGNAIKPAIHVYKGHKLLVEKTDYTIAYKNNKNVSSGVTDNKKKPQIIITMKGEYSGNEPVYFDIVPTPLDKIEVSDGSLNAVYKAKKKNQLKPVLMYGSEKLKYGNKELVFKWYKADSEGKATDVESTCIEAGTYAVKVFKGSGSNFSDSSNNGRQIATITVTDSRILMSSVKISGFKSNLPYNKGDEVLQAVTLTYKDKSGTYTLKESKTSGDGGDYTVTYSDNREAGTATVIFEATEGGRFCGRLIKTFKITGKCVLTQGKNGELNTGEAGVILGTGSGQDAFDFTGSNITPVVTVKASIVNNSGVAELVTLKQGTDFTVSYKNNKAVAAADAKNKKNKDIAPQVIIKGKGNYVFGTAKNAGIVKRFAITQADLNSLVLTIADKAYSKKNGDYKKTKIVFCDSDYRDLKLKEGRDYDVGSYITSDSTQAPAAGQTVTVTITGKGSYKGTVKGSYRISDKSYKDISKAKVVVNPNAKGNAQACVYTGSGIEPGQTGQPGLILTMGSGKKMVTLAPKTVSGGTVTGDYEIIGYYNNVNPGKGAVILIRGIGSYRGIRAVKFTISAAKVSSRWGGVYVQ
ncbi:MAG: Ig-like domain-containing protein, partial [Lachnospiraceae bacterium]|nr:Ig-like domain-containing protein [Lachnospiraceae bacterium]